MGKAIRILIVEDNPTDRQLLQYLLQDRFEGDAKFRLAETLQTCLEVLQREVIFDCVILDLTLPDSTGRDTFDKVYRRHPSIPIIVMTHNKDLELAKAMMAAGAADYITKDYTEENELFRRVVFAIEKHRRSIHMSSSTNLAAYRQVETARANMISAHESGQHSAIRDTTVETVAALANLSTKMTGEFQKVSHEVTSLKTQFQHTTDTVERLDQEILRGHATRPSMRSQLDMTIHRITELETSVEVLEAEAKQRTQLDKVEEGQMVRAQMSNRTKVLIAILALIGTLVTAWVSYNIGIAVRGANTPKPQTTTVVVEESR